MSTKYLGHALFDLPRPHALPPVMVKLSKEETLIYRYVPVPPGPFFCLGKDT